MSIFVIKIIACITMFLDHIKYADPIFVNWCTVYMGRIAFPLFAFMITEGYVHTKDLNKYIKRLVNFAIISQIPFMLFRTLTGNWLILNVLFGFVLGIQAIKIFEKINNKIIAIFVDIIIMIFASLIKIEYGWYAVSMILILYVFKKNKVVLSIMYILLVILYYAINGLLSIMYIPYIILTVLPLAFILLYNGEKGRDVKWVFYIFYPLHLSVVYLLSIII